MKNEDFQKRILPYIDSIQLTYLKMQNAVAKKQIDIEEFALLLDCLKSDLDALKSMGFQSNIERLIKHS